MHYRGVVAFVASVVWSAGALHAEGRDEAVAARYLSVLAQNPANEQAAIRVWELRDAFGGREGLLEKMRAVVSGHPMAPLAMGEVYLRAGDREAAAAALGAMSADALDLRTTLRLADLLRRAGEPGRAREIRSAAAERHADDPAALEELAVAASAVGGDAEALACWQRIADSGTADQRIRASEAISDIHARRGDHAAAAEEAGRLVENLAPGHWLLPAALNRLFFHAQEAGTLGDLEEAWKRGPGNAERLAALAAYRGDRDGRMHWLREGLRLEPNNVALRRELAFALLASGRVEEASAEFDEASTALPSDPELMMGRAETAALLGDETRAEEFIDRALRLAGSDSREARLNALRRLGLHAASERMLRAAITRDPSPPDATFALADFLEETGRMREAMALVESLPPEHALRIAGWLKERSLNGSAEEWARRAVDADPRDARAVLFLADSLQSRKEDAKALKVLLQYAPASVSAVDEDLDRRLFMVMRDVDGDEDPALRMASARAFAENLARAARGNDADIGARLRAARWARWIGDDQEAVALLREGEPTLSVHLALASALEATGSIAEAIAELEAAGRLAPRRAQEFEREIAHMEASRGNHEAAIARLHSLLQGDPENPALLKDLATSMEAAGNAYAALPVWKRAFSAAQPADKIQLVKPTLACYSRLGQPDASVKWLGSAARGIVHENNRRDFCAVAALHIRENGLESAWAAALASLAAEDPAWLAHALEFNPQLSVRAGADPPAEAPEAMRLQRDEAAAGGNFERALVLARRLAESRTAGSEDSIALARILESAGRREDAIHAWDRVVVRHRLSPGALMAAGSAFYALGERRRAEEAWRMAASAGKIPPTEMLRLGQFSAARGERDQALEDFSAVLRANPPDPLPGANPAPQPLRLHDPDPGMLSSQQARLLALQEMGALLANSPERDALLFKHAEGGALERAWALAGAGNYEKAISTWLQESDSQISVEESRALIALALEGGLYEQIPSLVSTHDWQEAVSAWRAMLEAGWHPDLQSPGALSIQDWPAHVRIQCAELLAANGALRAAEAIGDPVGLPDERFAPALFRRAGWQLALRMPGRAAESLDRLLEHTPPPTSFDSIGASALRARYLLEPAESRKKWAAGHLDKLRASGDGPRAHAFASALLAAIERDNRGFADAVRQWLAAGGSTQPTRILREGSILEGWHLAELARDLYRVGLEADPAISALRGETAARTALQNRLLTSRLVHSAPSQTRFLVREWMAQGAGSQQLLAAAAEATGAGRFETAQTIYQSLIETTPVSPLLVHNMLAIARFPGCFPDALLTWFHAANPARRAALGAPVVLQLADVLAAEGRIDEAIDVLAAPGVEDPDGGIALRLAALHTALGNPAEAAMSISRAGNAAPVPADPVAKLLTAGPERAVEALEEFLATDPPASVLLEAAGRLEEEAPSTLDAIGPDRAQALLSQPSNDTTLASRTALARLALARHFGTLPQLRETLLREWKNGRGDPLSAEILTRIAIDEKNADALHDVIGEILASGKAEPGTLEGLAGFLLENGFPNEAVRIYEIMDDAGIASHSVTLAFAEALWKAGRRAEAIDIADAMSRAAEIDPALGVSLAAFWVSVDRPHRALAEIERENLPPIVKHRMSPLASTARSLLAKRPARQ